MLKVESQIVLITLITVRYIFSVEAMSKFDRKMVVKKANLRRNSKKSLVCWSVFKFIQSIIKTHSLILGHLMNSSSHGIDGCFHERQILSCQLSSVITLSVVTIFLISTPRAHVVQHDGIEGHVLICVPQSRVIWSQERPVFHDFWLAVTQKIRHEHYREKGVLLD